MSAHVRSKAKKRLVLIIASEPAIFAAESHAPERKPAEMSVFVAAKTRQTSALSSERPIVSPLALRPTLLLFHKRSPTNIVTDLVAKSAPTIPSATRIEPPKKREVHIVTTAAIARHEIAFASERWVVSSSATWAASSARRTSARGATATLLARKAGRAGDTMRERTAACRTPYPAAPCSPAAATSAMSTSELR
eukprot:CAMPEP_0180021320 /NCGR_PEP_ID=MMETSP0984-20121128/22258_1 /TAXON_ID=483367 /ORGANISM="non described non described, Strain CCMP 2436" /LENGTH=193 /DNA_ID=CAMNT_0021945275 /DNA_START=315 /DNA_END=892 /DNA_ORIENTATION=-